MGGEEGTETGGASGLGSGQCVAGTGMLISFPTNKGEKKPFGCCMGAAGRRRSRVGRVDKAGCHRGAKSYQDSVPENSPGP